MIPYLFVDAPSKKDQVSLRTEVSLISPPSERTIAVIPVVRPIGEQTSFDSSPHCKTTISTNPFSHDCTRSSKTVILSEDILHSKSDSPYDIIPELEHPYASVQKLIGIPQSSLHELEKTEYELFDVPTVVRSADNIRSSKLNTSTTQTSSSNTKSTLESCLRFMTANRTKSGKLTKIKLPNCPALPKTVFVIVILWFTAGIITIITTPFLVKEEDNQLQTQNMTVNKTYINSTYAPQENIPFIIYPTIIK